MTGTNSVKLTLNENCFVKFVKSLFHYLHFRSISFVSVQLFFSSTMRAAFTFQSTQIGYWRRSHELVLILDLKFNAKWEMVNAQTHYNS